MIINRELFFIVFKFVTFFFNDGNNLFKSVIYFNIHFNILINYLFLNKIIEEFPNFQIMISIMSRSFLVYRSPCVRTIFPSNNKDRSKQFSSFTDEIGYEKNDKKEQ